MAGQAPAAIELEAKEHDQLFLPQLWVTGDWRGLDPGAEPRVARWEQGILLYGCSP